MTWDYQATFEMGKRHARQGKPRSFCPFHPGGKSMSVSEKGEKKRFIVTVAGLKEGWIDGWDTWTKEAASVKVIG